MPCPLSFFWVPLLTTHTHTHTCTHAHIQPVAPYRTTCIPLNGVKLWAAWNLTSQPPLPQILTEDQGSLISSFSSLSFCCFFFFTLCLQLLLQWPAHSRHFHAFIPSCFSHVWLFATLWTVARQAPLSMEFSRQEYWNAKPFPPPGDLPNPVTLTFPELADRFYTTSVNLGSPGTSAVITKWLKERVWRKAEGPNLW